MAYIPTPDEIRQRTDSENRRTMSTPQALAMARALGFLYGRLESILAFAENGIYKSVDDLHEQIQATLDEAQRIEKGEA